MSKIFEIAIFTASTKPYCDPLVKILDKQKLISHKLYRTDCIKAKSSTVISGANF